ncbi:alpha/beta hydrolase [Amycolatopsis sp. PS_44_ISF1]|uniref:alpha/beta hydrolase n=1 Tax=Amycolatopsis sp. PS_44_ISF1 TaxID=2974917 RepID=UPI0028E03FFD|nr:alpha/beta hydrolase [Amycolatopsis sp. PS_44_ISF1]MDT8910295.1 alpha/beta hydrolase [Amycolatopsis sp. PS_44_ISF1]
MRTVLSLALAAMAVVSATAGVAEAAAPGPQAPSPPSPPSPQWGACPADVTKPGLQCATVQVPLDYRQPDGRKIAVAISRLASQNPEKRRGVLLVNQGGPGETGLQWPADLRDGPTGTAKLPQSVLDSYDIIGFDPRGVGHSTPVTCNLTPEQQVKGNIPPYARNAADVVKQSGAAQAIARQCATSSSAWMLPYVTTANTARDMDRIREALGEPKISYDGYSYGTYLGAVYTTLFPQRSDRIILDSSLGPGGLDYDALRRFGPGFQQRFPDFAKYAAAQPGHPLGSTPAQVTAKFNQLAELYDRNPVPGLDGAAFRLVSLSLLYNDKAFPRMVNFLVGVDPSQPPSAQAPKSAAPEQTGDAPAAGNDNIISSYFYVTCGDSSWPTSLPGYQLNVAVDRALYPMFGAAGSNVGTCAYWPSKPVEPKVRITGRGPTDVLMMQNLRDPATPLAGALQTRVAFGNRARMVTVDGGGHGVYLVGQPNTCASDAVTGYLVEGRLPVHDKFCAAQ